METDNQKQILNGVMKYISNEMDKIIKDNATKEIKLEKADILFRLYKIVDNFEELQPTLEQFFLEKAKKEKFGDEKDGR